MEIEVFFEENLKVNAKVGEHIVKTDQPVRAGGNDTANSPFELFLASLATCAGIFVKQFCASRGIDTKGIRLIQRHVFNPETHMIGHIEIEVIL
ncbi:MAG: osmotically inducible protein OsmC, partial [Chlorobiales bacterium]|nr:osmotically inducible protein OsmC [Chlorobiales bacterium]